MGFLLVMVLLANTNNPPSIILFITDHLNNTKKELIFLGLSGIFLGSLTLLNILGTSKFIDYSFTIYNIEIPFVIAIGVLPYPFTFLCTDLISELYGKKRANQVVWMGLILNLWVIFFCLDSWSLRSP